MISSRLLTIFLFVLHGLYAPLAIAEQQEVAAGSLILDGHKGALPLLDVKAEVSVTGMVARTSITQTFKNPSQDWVNARYLFPLPEGGAVDSLLMKIGARVIQGQVQPKNLAQKIFQQAKREGKKASLVKWTNGNLFSNQVANIGPLEEVEITIGYQEVLLYEDEKYSFRLPLAITDRYVPAQNEEHSDAGLLLDKLKVVRKRKDAPSSQLTIKVDIDSGFPISQVLSSSHDLNVDEVSNSEYQITLAGEHIPDRDFLLTWKPMIGSEPSLSHVSTSTKNGEYGLVMLMPPTYATENSLARELVYVLDTSGSMSGQSIVQAKAALRYAVEQLSPNDTFNLIEFNSYARSLWPVAKPASVAHKKAALRFIDSLHADGGTEIAKALNLALKNQPESNGVRQVVFVTDGSVGNEFALMKLIEENLGSSRLFTLGIGAAPNSYFMREAALAGKGTFTYISKLEDVQQNMQSLLNKLAYPVLADIELSVGQDTEFYPRNIPDLYLGQPLVISYRSPNELENLEVKGWQGEGVWQDYLQLGGELNIEEQVPEQSNSLSKLWAKFKIDELDRQARKTPQEQDQLNQLMQQVAMQHELVSKFTSLVAVDVTPSKPQSVDSKNKDVPHHEVKGSQTRALGHMPQTATPAQLHLYLGMFALVVFVVCRVGRT